MSIAKLHLFIITLLLCSISVVAQNAHRQKVLHAVSKVDSILDAHKKIKVDTNYIARPSSNWTVKLRGRGYGNFVTVRGNHPDIGDFDSRINTPLKTTIGVSANYRGLSVSLAVNPAKLFEKNSSRNINLAFYNNRYGADLSYSSTENLKTNVTYGNNNLELTLTDSHLQQMSASVYYVFNGKRFSYPAAFTHSWIQRRSAGSFLLSTGFYLGRFKTSYDIMTDYMSLEKSISMNHISIGAGYSYNYVPNKQWLLHLSLVPHIIAWYDYRYSTSLDADTNLPLEKSIPYKFPGMGGVGRFGATYNWKNYFSGFSSVIQSSYVGIDNKEMSAGNTWWRVEVFCGMRF